MTGATDWRAMIDAARAENANGIEMRRGKKYTSVAIRVEMARRHLGDLIGVESEIIHYGAEKGAPIVVRATIRGADGRVLAQGTAEEIRGQGQVNSTSALENAETSAIGRALAALGLAGGEFASANEMDAVDRKSEPAKAAPQLRADVRRAMEAQAPATPFDDVPPAVEAAMRAISEKRTLPELAKYWAQLNLDAKDIASAEQVIAAKDRRKAELTEKGQAA